MDHICEKCKNSTLIIDGENTAIPHQLLTCGFSSQIFIACQIACTEDYFEPKSK